MANQRHVLTQAQREARYWALGELIWDTTLSQYFIGDIVTLGGTALTGGIGGPPSVVTDLGGGLFEHNDGLGNVTPWNVGAGGASTFVSLTDTPVAMGAPGEFLQVNLAGTELEFVSAPPVAETNTTLAYNFAVPPAQFAEIVYTNELGTNPVLSIASLLGSAPGQRIQLSPDQDGTLFVSASRATASNDPGAVTPALGSNLVTFPTGGTLNQVGDFHVESYSDGIGWYEFIAAGGGSWTQRAQFKPVMSETVTSIGFAGIGGPVSEAIRYTDELGADTDLSLGSMVSTDPGQTLTISPLDGLFYVPAAAGDTNLFTVTNSPTPGDGLTATANVRHLLDSNAFSILETNMGLQIAPGIPSGIGGGTGAAYFRTTAGSQFGVLNSEGVVMDFAAGERLYLANAGDPVHRPGAIGEVLTSGGPAGFPTWQPVPGSAVDLNTTVSDESATALGAAPVTPPAGPDAGDVHIETYSDAIGYWSYNGVSWVLASSFAGGGTNTNIYSTSGSIPAATTRLANIPDDSNLVFRGLGTASNTLISVAGASNTVNFRGIDSGLSEGAGVTVSETGGMTLQFRGAAELRIDDGINPVTGGADGEVLTSQGVGLAPKWEPVGPNDTLTSFNLATNPVAPFEEALAYADENAFTTYIPLTQLISTDAGNSLAISTGADKRLFVPAGGGDNIYTIDGTIPAGVGREVLFGDNSTSLTVQDPLSVNVLQVGPGVSYLRGGSFASAQEITLSPTSLDLVFAASSPLTVGPPGVPNPGALGQVLTSQGPAAPPIWGPGGGDNYAVANLTADAIRTHTWDTFNQTENFTSGAYERGHVGAGTSGYLRQQFNFFEVGTQNTAGTLVSEFRSTAAAAEMTHDVGLGNPVKVETSNNGIRFEFGDGVNKTLRLEGDPGAATEVLTSNGPALPPTWQPAASAANLYTIDGAIPAATNRSVTVPDGSLLRFGDSTLSSKMEINPAADAVTMVGASGANQGIVSARPDGIRLTFNGTSDLKLGLDPGTPFQVLTSLGAGNAPQWLTVNDTSIYTTNGNIVAGTTRTATLDGGSILEFVKAGTSTSIRMTEGLNTVALTGSGGAATTNVVTVSPQGVRLTFAATGDLELAPGVPGTPGQVVTSQGPNLPPTWEAPAPAGVTISKVAADWSGAGPFTLTITGAEHGQGPDCVVSSYWDTSVANSRVAFTADTVAINTANGAITFTSTTALDVDVIVTPAP